MGLRKRVYLKNDSEKTFQKLKVTYFPISTGYKWYMSLNEKNVSLNYHACYNMIVSFKHC